MAFPKKSLSIAFALVSTLTAAEGREGSFLYQDPPMYDTATYRSVSSTGRYTPTRPIEVEANRTQRQLEVSTYDQVDSNLEARARFEPTRPNQSREVSSMVTMPTSYRPIESSSSGLRRYAPNRPQDRNESVMSIEREVRYEPRRPKRSRNNYLETAFHSYNKYESLTNGYDQAEFLYNQYEHAVGSNRNKGPNIFKIVFKPVKFVYKFSKNTILNTPISHWLPYL